MKDLDIIRKEINSIDEQMAKLFEKRMQASYEVAMYKKENALPIEDSKREEELLLKNITFIQSSLYKEYYINYQKNVMKVSKDYQRRLLCGMKIAYCGVKGAYAYLASKKAFHDCEYVPYSTFTHAYMSVINGECDACVLPIENSYAGDVGEVMDLVFQGSLYINQMIDLEITHHLLGKKGTSLNDIKVVESHPQALAQCSEYIEQHHFKKEECANTAMASMQLAASNDKTKAVIASEETASIYDLQILQSNINTSRNNTTRFAIFSRVLNEVDPNIKMGEHFILVFTVLNEAGALAKTLNIIGSHGFNMRNLRSRPMKELNWNYYFFVELEGNINSYDGKEMLAELKTFCDCLKMVGCYYSHIDK